MVEAGITRSILSAGFVKNGSERASSINSRSLIKDLSTSDIQRIIVIARDVFGNTVVVVIFIPKGGGCLPPEHSPKDIPTHTSPRPQIPSGRQPQAIPTPQQTKPAQTSCPVQYENCRGNESTTRRIRDTLASLPKEQRESVRQVSVIGPNPYDTENGSDGPGNKLGWYNPSDVAQRDRIFVDSADVQDGLEHTVIHESFHAFTVQKLLTPFENFVKTGIDNNKGYGRRMKALWDLFVKSMSTQDRAGFPSKYAESFLDAYKSAARRARTLYNSGRISMHEARLMTMQTISVGFMEFLAELAANLQTGKVRPSSVGNATLRQAYAEMESLLTAANS